VKSLGELEIRRLEAAGEIKKLGIDASKVRDSIRLAERDIELAKSIRERDLDWCFSIAYNSMLQAGRALMFFAGYRPSAEAHHSAVVKFSAAYFGNECAELVLAFERMRRKRSVAVYDTVGAISENEADFAIDASGKFIGEVKRKISAILE
jgi:uncharacterized protein (UPF0332 family)